MAGNFKSISRFCLINSRRLCDVAKGAAVMAQQQAGLQNFPVPPCYKHIEIPEGRQKLRFLEKTPQFPAKAPHYGNRIDLVRGEEKLQTEFLHEQYGIVALNGGHLEWGHIEMIRMTVVRKMDIKKMFAVWRIESPWLPRVKKSRGKKMGGGKCSIDRYVVPIKANRVIIEFGGKISFKEALPILRIIAHNLPFEAEAISFEMMKAKRLKREQIEASNINPYTFKYLVQNNLLGCNKWSKEIDQIYFGKRV